MSRNQFLQHHKDNAYIGSNIPMAKHAQLKLEIVFFVYLWSVDVDAVKIAMSCFSLFCEEAEIRYGFDETAIKQLLPNRAVYLELAAASNTITSGRNALQKRILSLLRKIDQPTPGNKQAWYDTFVYQQTLTKLLQSYSTNRATGGSSKGGGAGGGGGSGSGGGGSGGGGGGGGGGGSGGGGSGGGGGDANNNANSNNSGNNNNSSNNNNNTGNDSGDTAGDTVTSQFGRRRNLMASATTALTAGAGAILANASGAGSLVGSCGGGGSSGSSGSGGGGGGGGGGSSGSGGGGGGGGGGSGGSGGGSGNVSGGVGGGSISSSTQATLQVLQQPTSASSSLSSSSNVSQEHELDDLMAEWANMTGFLRSVHLKRST